LHDLSQRKFPRRAAAWQQGQVAPGIADNPEALIGRSNSAIRAVRIQMQSTRKRADDRSRSNLIDARNFGGRFFSGSKKRLDAGLRTK
jgi:hypothetical protein